MDLLIHYQVGFCQNQSSTVLNIPINRYFSEIIQGKDVFEGQAVALLMWFPHPHVKFEFTSQRNYSALADFLADSRQQFNQFRPDLGQATSKPSSLYMTLLDVISVQVVSAS